MRRSPQKSQGSVGLDDFFDFIYEGEPEWAVITVKAPLDAAVEILAELRHAKRRFPNISLRPASNAVDEVAPGICVLELKGNPWVVIYRSLFFLAWEDIDLTVRDALELSKRLGTSALAFLAHDKFDALGYRFFDKGEPQKCSDTELAEGLVRDSQLCSADEETMAEICREKGIYLPCCHPVTDGKNYWIVTYPPHDLIERADLID